MRRSGSLIAGLGVAFIIVGLLDSSLDSSLLFAAAGIMIACGLALIVAGAFVGAKKKDLVSQMQAFQGGQGFTDPTQFDATAILKSVMEAQQQSGGDPEKLAEMLRTQFGGGEATVIEGGDMTVIGPGAGASSGTDPVELLTQLGELRDKGVLTDEQFEQQKKRLLG